MQRIVLILMCCFFGLHLSFAQSQDLPYKNQLIVAENKLKMGDFQGALAELDQVTSQYPQATDVFYAKGLLYGQIGDFESGLENATIAYEQESSVQNLTLLLDLFRATKNPDGMIEVLAHFRSKHPQQTFASRELISLLANEKKYEQALGIYDEEIKGGRTSDTLEVLKADVLVRKQEVNAAIALLQPLVGKSSFSPVYSTLGYIYQDQKKPKQAIEVLDVGLKLTKDARLHLDLADVYREDKKMKQSYEALTLAFESNEVDFGDKYRIMLELIGPASKGFSLQQVQTLANTLVLKHPRIADSHVVKGNVLQKRGNAQEARSLYMTAVGINPKHVDAWRMLINTDMQLKQIDDAIRHGQESLMANPGNAMLMYFTGLSYLMKEDHDSSRKMLEAALDHSEEENKYLQSVIYGTLGDLYHQLQMDAASDVAYEEAIALDSTNVTVLNNYAYYLSVRKKDLDKAEEYSRLSNELEPASSTFQDTYAWVLFQQGKYKDALVWIEKALKGDRVSAVLFEHYGDILAMVGREKEAVKQWEKALAMNGNGVDTNKINTKIKERKYVE